MWIEIKVTDNAESMIAAIAVGFGIELLNGRLDELKDTAEYRSFLQHFAKVHPQFKPETWDNLKLWLGYYNNPQDLELIFTPVFSRWITNTAQLERQLALLSIGIKSNDGVLTDKNKITIYLNNKADSWGVFCREDDMKKLASLPSLHVSYKNSNKEIPAPAQESIAKESDQPATRDDIQVVIEQETVDNPGQGNCGYYAFAIGLIHIMQNEHTYKNRNMFNLWASLSPELHDKYEDIINFNEERSNKELLDVLQSSLRLNLYGYLIKQLPIACAHSNVANNYQALGTNSIFRNFAELYHGEELDPNHNPFVHSVEIKQQLAQIPRGISDLYLLTKSLAQLFIRLLFNKEPEAVHADTAIADDSPIINCLMSFFDNWATHEDLNNLCNIFPVNLHIYENGTPKQKFNDLPHLNTVVLDNLYNAHWVTKVYYAKVISASKTPGALSPATLKTAAPLTVKQTAPHKDNSKKRIRFKDDIDDSPTSKSKESKPDETKELERLKQKIANATIEYIKYNRTAWLSIFHRHGKTGRQRAKKFNLDFQAKTDLTEARAAIVALLKDSKAGNTHPHSYRTMLLHEILPDLTESHLNLRQVSKYFKPLVSALKGIYEMPGVPYRC